MWGQPLYVELQPSIADVETVEFRLRRAPQDPNTPELPGDLVKLDYSSPYDITYGTREGGSLNLRWHDSGLYVIATAIRADASRVAQGWVNAFPVPTPAIPRFTMRPLVVVGTPLVKGVRVYRVPFRKVDLKVFAFGFHTRHKHRRVAVPIASERREGKVRTLLFDRDLAIDPEGSAWLQVLVMPKGTLKRFGVRIRARSLRARLVRNKRGDTVVEQNPDESRCWIAFPTHPLPNCKDVTGGEEVRLTRRVRK